VEFCDASVIEKINLLYKIICNNVAEKGDCGIGDNKEPECLYSNCKEDCGCRHNEPKSLWKSVGNSLKDGSEVLIKLNDGQIKFALCLDDDFWASHTQTTYRLECIAEYCVITDLINDYEAEKLKRLELEKRIERLEQKEK